MRSQQSLKSHRLTKPSEQRSLDLTKFKLHSILSVRANKDALGGFEYTCSFPNDDMTNTIELHSRTTMRRSFPAQLEAFEAQHERGEQPMHQAHDAPLPAPGSLCSDDHTEILDDPSDDSHSPAGALREALDALSVDEGQAPPAAQPASPRERQRSILRNLNGIEPIFQRLTESSQAGESVWNKLTEIAIQLCIYGSPLKRLPPARRWNGSLKATWVRALKDFAPYLCRVIEAYKANPENEQAKLDLINAYIERCALPAHIIIPASNLRPNHGRVSGVVWDDDMTTDLTIGPDNAPDTLMGRRLGLGAAKPPGESPSLSSRTAPGRQRCPSFQTAKPRDLPKRLG